MKIALIITTVLMIFFIIRSFRLAKQNIELQSAILSITTANQEEVEIVKEDFLKFISDSRDWAFQYIEQVQSEIKKFIDAVDHDIEYFDKYGEAIWTPLSKSMTNISAAYKDIKKLLPEETVND